MHLIRFVVAGQGIHDHVDTEPERHLALKLKHHNAGVHAKECPKTPLARDVFNAVEQARYEALGARKMTGVKQNLRAALEEQCRVKGYARINTREEGNLAEVMRLMVREALTGDAVPDSARAMVNAWRSDFAQKVLEDVAELKDKLANQRNFAKAVRRLLADMELEQTDEELESERDDQEDQDQQDPNKQHQPQQKSCKQQQSESTTQMDAQQEAEAEAEETDSGRAAFSPRRSSTTSTSSRSSAATACADFLCSRRSRIGTT
jgi:cobaltochelatase CobT